MKKQVADVFFSIISQKSILFFCITIVLSACASREENILEGVSNDTPQSTIHDDYSVDLSGFEVPNIPTDLQERAEEEVTVYDTFPYTLSFNMYTQEEILSFVKAESILLALEKQAPNSRFSLDKRIEDEVEIIKEILYNFGFYSAQVNVLLDDTVYPYHIEITIIPNTAYTISVADIVYPDNFSDPLFTPFAHLVENPPESLFDLGLQKNSVAETEKILTSTAQISTWFKERGFPFAKEVNSTYSVFQNTKSIEAKIDFNPGEFIRMGNVQIFGSTALETDFINKIKTWEYGEPWSDSAIQKFEQDLLSFGIFSYVDANSSSVEHDEIRDITLLLSDGPTRTWGGGVNYDITRQLGLQLFWEHRNLFNEAESFKIDTNLWLDTQEVSFDFRKPSVYKKNHNFDVNSVTLDTSYEIVHFFEDLSVLTNTYSIKGELGRLVGISSNAATVDPNTSRVREYVYIGTPIKFFYENGTRTFEQTNGYSLELELSPYYGKYIKEFTTLWAEAEAIKYFEIIDDSRLIFAMKVHAGVLSHVDATDVPPSLRFFLGGGNSIRGYGYQSIGPQDIEGDPIGGASFIEGSAELRLKITESVSLVPFFDMGNLFDSITFSNVTFKYSTGLGIRVVTPIGPLRFDAAIPIKDDTKDYKDFQLYVSIGQSF